ncbi:hypothetical protein IGI04_030919 [Brassica rapa subsp. trilocularis]|uniref:F-box associated domain-containing protein n=1 Tax=Brassica rapa subsp. trilocularis TaxID=1813537 RepID=A0ABQ7LS40_BRACM|nr:hypothetical protein IGI04_030919 [Brassica rapa subsp. trilocularis]
MSGCIRLEFLPSDVNLASLHYLNLTGCARLRSFPRISSNISRLLLGGTSIVEDEDCFFIGIISRLTELVWSDCPMRYMPSDFCAEYLVELIIPGSKLVQRIVNLSGFYLTPSALFLKRFGDSRLDILEPPTDPKDRSVNIGVRWYVGGKSGVHYFYLDVDSCKMDHLVMFHFGFPLGEVYSPPSKLGYNHVEFEFFLHNYACSCVRFGPGLNGGAESENNGDVMKRLREARGECGESSRCLVASSTFDTLSRKGPIPTRRVFWSSCRFLVNRSDTNCWDCEIPCPTLSYLINTPCLIIQCGTLIDISQPNPVILLPFIRAAPSLTVSFFYYRDDKAKPCYSHYVYDLNAETENSDEVTQCRCVTEES